MILAGIVAVIVALFLLDGMTGEDVVDLALTVAGTVAVILALAAAPWGPEFKSITVDDRGLTVGRRTLPAAAVGRTWHLEPTGAAGTVPRGRFEGMRITRSTFGFIATGDDAVVVEDRSRERPSAWLIATRDPEALIDALADLRREARP